MNAKQKLLERFNLWADCYEPGITAVALGKVITSELCRQEDSAARSLSAHEADYLHALQTENSSNKKAGALTPASHVPSPLTAKSERNGNEN